MKPMESKIIALFMAFLFILAVPATAAVYQATGYLTLFRIHDVGTGYGPGSDFLDAEVIIRLDTKPGEAFGFQLRDDANRAVRQAMLDLLRDAFSNGWPVTINYDKETGKTNSVLFRVWVSAP